MTTDHNPATEVLSAYAAAVNAKDVEAFVALYDEDVHVYDTWGTWEYNGIEAWRAMAASGWRIAHEHT